MSEETQAAPEAEVNALATEAAPDAGATAAPADSPVVGEGEQPEKSDKPAKTFTQEEVDALVGKRLSREERKWQRDLDQRIERQLAAKAGQPAQPAAAPEAPPKPKPEQFATTEDYVEAMAAFKAEEIVRTQVQGMEKLRREQYQRQHQEQVLATFREREEAAKDKYEDFEEVAYNPALPITPAMATTIQESELGPEIAYYFGKNPKEADRIARLSPFLQAKEIGRIEGKMSSAPPAPKPSAAPAPITPINGSRSSPGVVDTTDPKSLQKLGTSAWIEADRQRQREKWEREHR